VRFSQGDLSTTFRYSNMAAWEISHIRFIYLFRRDFPATFDQQRLNIGVSVLKMCFSIKWDLTTKTKMLPQLLNMGLHLIYK
jgi:hypothetical protein